MTNIKNEIIEANKGFMNAFNSNSPEGMGQVYTEEAKLYPTNSVIIKGREAVENFWKGVFEAGVAKAKLVTNDVEDFGETAIEEGSYSLYDANDKVLDEGKYIVIWKKVNDQWKYDKDIWNTSLPA